MQGRSCSISMEGEKVIFNSSGMSLVEAWGYMNRIFIQDAIKAQNEPIPKSKEKVDTLMSPPEKPDLSFGSDDISDK